MCTTLALTSRLQSTPLRPCFPLLLFGCRLWLVIGQVTTLKDLSKSDARPLGVTTDGVVIAVDGKGALVAVEGIAASTKDATAAYIAGTLLPVLGETLPKPLLAIVAGYALFPPCCL